MHLVRSARFWLACVAGWCLLALVEATSNHFEALRGGREADLLAGLLRRLAADAIWVPVAALTFVVVERAVASGAGPARVAARGALLGLALAPFYTTSNALAHPLLTGGGLAEMRERLRAIPPSTYVWDAFIDAALTLTAYAITLYRRSLRHERESSELRARLAQAELELLRAQLEPHFLFNALNTVAGLIRGARPELATSALARLSELLRYVIEASRQERVPLAWELQFVASYLELQQIRYGARLQFAIQGDPDASGREVPPLLLQPLIENAVVHGVARTSDEARIDLRVAADREALRIQVHSTRDQQAAADGARTGVGLSNTRRRLERIYGDGFQFAAGPDGPAAYQVTISLPPERT